MIAMQALFTSSWDDGHPLDLKLADLLAKHGFDATFFVPLSNREGLPVMTAAQMRSLHAGGFEIGSHTLDHCYLTTVDDSTAAAQIAQGKSELEQVLGRTVPGFCYPGGKHHARHVSMVRQTGFSYARHTVNFHTDVLPEPLLMPVGLQCYPHRRDVFLRNYARYGDWPRRTSMLVRVLRHADLAARLRDALDLVCRQGGVFHLWGHTWELDQFDGWALLDDFLRYASERIPPAQRLSNLDTLRHRQVLGIAAPDH